VSKGGWRKALPAVEVTPRDVIQWPYQSYHYWNMPLGADADLQPCGMTAPAIFRAERDLLFIDPSAPEQTIYAHTGGWNTTPRCDQTTGTPLANLNSWNPLPMTVFTLGGDWDDNNQCTSFLSLDGNGDIRRTETQPFVFCGAGVAYSQFSRSGYQGGYIDHRAVMPAEDGNGAGVEAAGVGGSHGGSGIEAFGGNIRLRHIAESKIDTALKIVLNTARWLSTVDAQYPRWPAWRVDAGWANYGQSRPGGTGTAPVGMRMGCLLALPQSFSLASLDTPAGAMIAEALQTYGGYVCDGAQAQDGFYLGVEYGPQGDVETTFAAKFGHQFRQRNVDNPTGIALDFFNDMKTVIQNLHLVADNSSTNIGGSGTRVGPMALALPGE
jgi:hypothetical protein